MIDLEHGRALLAAMTPGKWTVTNGYTSAPDLAGIAWLRNNADELLRLAAVGQAHLRREAAIQPGGTVEELHAATAALDAAVRAALEPKP